MSENSRLEAASIGLNVGTLLAYISGIAFLAQVNGSLVFALQEAAAGLGIHVIAYGLLKTGLHPKDKMMLQAAGTILVALAVSFYCARYYDWKVVSTGTTFLFSLAAALASWRYNWLYRRK